MQSALLVYFAAFTIFISSLGLLGLAYHAANTGMKSLSIRRVLGASLSQLFYSFSKDFGIVLLLASLIAFPLAYWLMTQWLESFAYRISLDWSYFALSIIGMIFLVITIIGLQFHKVASMNPPVTLRND